MLIQIKVETACLGTVSEMSVCAVSMEIAQTDINI